MLANELDLIKRCQNGDLDAFGDIYELYVNKIYDFIYFRTSHKETAEDLTSLVFIKALEKIKDFNIELGYFSAWIYRIARNSVIDYYRTKKTNANIDDHPEIKDSSDLEYEIEIRCSIEKVKKHINKLNKEQRDILVMRIWDGLSYDEISKIIGKSEANCKVIASRSLALIRKESILVFLILIVNQFITSFKR
ncbi:MAG: sigma-70 family RNA polymerase sigma factor [Patescibacteria group bacterium]